MRMGGSRYDDRRDMTMGGSRYFPDEWRDPYMGYDEPEMRRRRDSRGRYTSARMGGYGEPWMGEDDDMEMRYPSPSKVYDARPQMNRKIGFSIDGEMEHLPNEFSNDYRSTIDYPQMNEMEYRKGTKSMSGHASGTGAMPFSKEMAMEWTQNMENPDGTVGPHWPLEKVKEVMAQKKLEGSPYEWYAVLNMVYSDYSAVAKKMNVNTVDFYVCMAKAFLDDPDAGEDKLAKYYEYIVK